MYKDKHILAIIPARGGSKGIPKKNVILLNGHPLISYSIKQASRSRYIDKFVVSSDSDEILSIAKQYGSEVIKRPKKMALDNSTIDEAIRHVLEYLKNKDKYTPDCVVILQPTSPLRKVSTIDKAIADFVDNEKQFDSLLPVCPVDPKLGHIKNGRYMPLNTMNRQRQELKVIYRECGTVFVFKPKRIFKRRSLYGRRILPLIINDQAESLDINDKHDLRLADYFLKV